MSQQEDDLRALSKIMDLLRGLSIILVVANLYYFSQHLVAGWQFHAETMKILNNLDDAGKLFHNTWNAKMVGGDIPRSVVFRHKRSQKREN